MTCRQNCFKWEVPRSILHLHLILLLRTQAISFNLEIWSSSARLRDLGVPEIQISKSQELHPPSLEPGRSKTRFGSKGTTNVQAIDLTKTPSKLDWE
jgi:hypothetical protein